MFNYKPPVKVPSPAPKPRGIERESLKNKLRTVEMVIACMNSQIRLMNILGSELPDSQYSKVLQELSDELEKLLALVRDQQGIQRPTAPPNEMRWTP